MILLDLFILGVIILFTFNGFKQGWLRALFSLLSAYLVFIVTALLYEKPAEFLRTSFDIPAPQAHVICFATIFVVLLFLSWIINSILMGLLGLLQTKWGLSRIVGAIFGSIRGILIASIIIMNIAFYPVRSPFKDAISYKTMKHVAPRIRDFTIGHIPFLKNTPPAEESENKS